jgi:hypothetical protein
MPEEVAPPTQNWVEHLKSLENAPLAELAKDYNWLAHQRVSPDSHEQFAERRAAIIAECERRGMKDIAEACRRES